MGAHPGPAARVRFVLSFHFVITPRRGSGLSEGWRNGGKQQPGSERFPAEPCPSYAALGPARTLGAR